jgi:2-polyprenyl-6-methoxyphenol hydroxylase-like FAD-dependent oxidoreductase
MNRISARSSALRVRIAPLSEPDTQVLIVGGGIAGLAAAISLRHHGIDFQLFERVEDVQRVQAGSGLRLGYNVGRAFSHLGILEGAEKVSSPLRGVLFETDEGKHLGTTTHVEGETHLGTRRPQLHEFLLGAADQDRLNTGSEFVRFEQDDDGVTAHFADGSTARGEILIGADGLKSTVREQIHGESELRYAGYCARRGVLETDAEARMRVILGPGKRFAYFPVGGNWVYWSASTNEEEGLKEPPEVMKEAVLERFEGWPEPVEEFVRGTDDANTFHADTYDRDPLRRWGEGRVTLLGDAAHPMTWDQGQGAGQGIEGALFLAKRLAEGGDEQVATLRAWEKERIPRARRFVMGSRRMGKLCQSESPVVRLFRNRALKVLTSPRMESRHLLVDYS